MSLEISADEFQELTREVARLATEYLERLDAGPIRPDVTGASLVETLGGAAPERGRRAGVVELLRAVVDGSRKQNGRFLGYVMGSGEPAGAAADLLASVLNQNLTAWRSAPAGVTVERTVVGWLAEAIGCGEFHGSLTGGGSSANLMGLAMAREAKLPANERGGAVGVVYASEQVHMSIGKAVALLGLGRQNLRLVPTDANFRMRANELERAVARDRADGLTPIAVVASAGTVATGASTPSQPSRTWRAASGSGCTSMERTARSPRSSRPSGSRGSRAPTPCRSTRTSGCTRPSTAAACCSSRRDAARRTFARTGDYTRSFTADPLEGFAFFEESLELSRRFRALRLWTSIQYHGMNAFREAMRQDLSHARSLADRVRGEPTLELLAPVELSAVCFRYRFAESPDARNAKLLEAVNRRGRVYLSNATIRGAFALRACFVNHRTTSTDVDVVVDEVLAAARDVR